MKNKGGWILFAVFLICLTACSQKYDNNQEEALKASNIQNITKNIDNEFADCQKESYKNLDFTKCSNKISDFNGCFKLTIDDSIKQNKSGKELFHIFEEYCKLNFTDYHTDYVLFSCPDDNKYYKKEEDDGFYAWYPRYEDHKTQIENGDIKVNFFIYRNPEQNQYLWWGPNDSNFPHWLNRGKAFSSFKTADTKVSSWIPSDIPNNRSLSVNLEKDESYSLDGEQVSVQEAVSFFENDYLNTLPDIGRTNKNYTLSVTNVEAVKLTNGEYAYILYFSAAYKSIPYDHNGEKTLISDSEEIRYEQDGQAIMVKKNEIDTYVSLSFPKVKEGKEIKTILSLKDAVAIMSEKLTNEVKFQVQTVEFVYQGLYTSNNSTKAELFPSWRFIAYNPNDSQYYNVYINAEDGKFSCYSYILLREAALEND